MNEFANYALGLLSSSESAPARNPHFDQLLIDFAEQLVAVADPSTEFDDMTLCALVDGLLPEEEAEIAMASLRTNPRRLKQYIELRTSLDRYAAELRAEVERSGLSESGVDPPVASRPGANDPPGDLQARRTPRRLLKVAAALAALLMVGLLVSLLGPGIPASVDARLEVPGHTVRSASWTVGDTLQLSASVDPDVFWAVVAVAGPMPGRPLTAWVAQAGIAGSAEGRVQYTETVELPVGRRAYLVVASKASLDDLPAIVARWESDLRERTSSDRLMADAQALAEAEAEAQGWSVSQAMRVTVVEEDQL
jgi:hypothetical protein